MKVFIVKIALNARGISQRLFVIRSKEVARVATLLSGKQSVWAACPLENPARFVKSYEDPTQVISVKKSSRVCSRLFYINLKKIIK